MFFTGVFCDHFKHARTIFGNELNNVALVNDKNSKFIWGVKLVNLMCGGSLLIRHVNQFMMLIKILCLNLKCRQVYSVRWNFSLSDHTRAQPTVQFALAKFDNYRNEHTHIRIENLKFLCRSHYNRTHATSNWEKKKEPALSHILPTHTHTSIPLTKFVGRNDASARVLPFLSTLQLPLNCIRVHERPYGVWFIVSLQFIRFVV